MIFRPHLIAAILVAFTLSRMCAIAATAGSPTEYSEHFGALSKLSVAVAEAMPPEQYAFRPDPGFMSFGELISHIATTNYAFCAGLKDSAAPAMPSPTDKQGIVKLLDTHLFSHQSRASKTCQDHYRTDRFFWKETFLER